MTREIYYLLFFSLEILSSYLKSTLCCAVGILLVLDMDLGEFVCKLDLSVA